MGNRVRLILNAKSGAAKAEPAEIARLFADCDCGCEITELGPGVDLAALAKRDLMEVAFVAAGGDGTVNAVANAVIGTERRMGVLPVGTLNHFAKDLGLPLELADAVHIAAGSEVRSIDAAEVNGRFFVNNSSLGVYPSMVLVRERMKKGGLNKWASLVLASGRAMVRFRCLEVELEVDGAVRQCTTPFLFVGNNQYELNGVELGKREHLDKGELSLYLAPGATRIGLVRMFFAALRGRIQQDPDYASYRVKQFAVSVRSRSHRKSLHVSVDGEVGKMMAPLRYRVHPGALQVLCAKDGR